MEKGIDIRGKSWLKKKRWMQLKDTVTELLTNLYYYWSVCWERKSKLCWSVNFKKKKKKVGVKGKVTLIHIYFVFSITDFERPQVHNVCRLVVIRCITVRDDDWSVSFPWRWWRRSLPLNTQWHASLSKMAAKGSRFHTQSGRYHVYWEILWASLWKNLSLGFATRVDTNRPAQVQKLATFLKLRL